MSETNNPIQFLHTDITNVKEAIYTSNAPSMFFDADKANREEDSPYLGSDQMIATNCYSDKVYEL